MQGTKLIGPILLTLGILAVASGGFSYTKSSDHVKLRPLEIDGRQRPAGREGQTVMRHDLPHQWAGAE